MDTNFFFRDPRRRPKLSGKKNSHETDFYYDSDWVDDDDRMGWRKWWTSTMTRIGWIMMIGLGGGSGGFGYEQRAEL